MASRMEELFRSVWVDGVCKRALANSSWLCLATDSSLFLDTYVPTSPVKERQSCLKTGSMHGVSWVQISQTAANKGPPNLPILLCKEVPGRISCVNSRFRNRQMLFLTVGYGW